MRSTKKLSLDDYVDFCRNPHEHRLIYNHINQVINMHGFVKVQKALKAELLEQLRSIDLMVPERSTLKENISSSAILTLTEVKEDLASLEWNECPIQSILAVGSGKETQLIEGDDLLLHTNQGSSSTCITVVVGGGGGGKGEKLKRKRKRISLSELGTETTTAPSTTLPLLTSAEITPPSSSLSLGSGRFITGGTLLF